MKRNLRSINALPLLAFSVLFFSQGSFHAKAVENVNAVTTWTLSASPEGNAMNVNWSTSAETNSDYFIVQRSKDGILFDDVMQEIAAGNSSSVSKYSITDYQPYTGISYYRVVEVDINGKLSKDSSIVTRFEKELSMTVYPGTSAGSFNVSIESKKQKQVLLVVRDIQGREFFSKVIILRSVNEVVAIDPEGALAQGIYTVVASSSNAIFEKKIVITK